MPTQKQINEAIKVLNDSGYAVKVWSPEDIQEVIGSMVSQGEVRTLTQEEEQRVIADVMMSRYWNNLRDCLDQEWYAIEAAVYESIDEQGLLK